MLLELLIDDRLKPIHERVKWDTYKNGTDIDEQVINFNINKRENKLAFMSSDKHRKNSIVCNHGQRYEKIRELGQGSSVIASLYAESRNNDNKLVIKREKPKSSNSFAFFKNKEKQYDGIKSLNLVQREFFHHNDQFDVEEYGGTSRHDPHVTTEPYISGITLRKRLTNATCEESKSMFINTLQEINKMHNELHMSHGDTGNLNNILVDIANGDKVRLCDLGTARKYTILNEDS